MKFKILLYLLARMILQANKKNDLFKKMVAGKKLAFQIKTRNGKIARHFTVNQGKIQSKPKAHPAPDFSIVFETAKYGFFVLTSKDKNAFLQGILEKKIKIEGDFSLIIWFQNLMGQLKKKKNTIPANLTTIGFIGAGFIGAPMIRSLIRNGFAVKAFDKDPAAVEIVSDFGAVACDSLKDLMDTDLLVVMVNNMDQVCQVVWGICDKLSPTTPLKIAVMSTVSPDEIVQLQKDLIAKGFGHIHLLDAPVSGAPLNAEAGKLAIMVGGDEADYKAIKPALDAMGETIFYMGELGRGSAMKLVNNILGISSAMITAEAVFLGVKKGLQPELMVEVINSSSGKNFLTSQWPLSLKLFEMLTTNETRGAKDALFTTGMKDLSVAKKWAQTHGIQLHSVENGMAHIEHLSSGKFNMMLKTILENSV